MRAFTCAAITLVTMAALVPATFGQAGSTGGTVGKQDKSVSGGEEQSEPSGHPQREPRSRGLQLPSRAAKPTDVLFSSGQYDMVSSGYSADFNITVRGSTFSGSSKWTCCPGPRIDPIVEGRIQNGRISFVRDCNGQGAGTCRQEYTGVVSGNSASGQWTGTGAILGAGSWTMRKR
jgi:hypothetical protein